MKRSLWVLLGASIVAALAVCATAAATGPDTIRYSFEDHYVDTYTCPGIPIDTELTGNVTIAVYSPTRVRVQERLIYSATANGKSFVDNESFTEFANPETGISRFVGSVVSIQVPGWGNVLLDVGTVTIDFTTDPWTVLHSGGPHPLVFEGYGALCEYLSTW
jgi:hypothetical protein